MIIGADIEAIAAANPHKIAIACGEEHIAWGELATLTNRLSNWIRSTTPEGAGIALILPNWAALPVLVLAIARAGRIAQVFDPAWPDSLIIKTTEMNRTSLAIVTADRLASLNGTVHLRAGSSIKALTALVTDQPETFAPNVTPEKSFYVGFTSGSTGSPKGYRRNHQSWIESFAVEQAEFGHTTGDVIIAPGSLSHSLFLYAAIHALHIGATVIISPAFRPSKIDPLIALYCGTILYGVPAQLMMIAAARHDQQAPQLASLRWIISSGSKWPERHREQIRKLYPGVNMAEFYGASELSFVSLAKEPEKVPPGSVGRPFAGVEIKILDAEDAHLPPMQIGQIYVRSAMVFESYTGDRECDRLDRSGAFLSVGDMGYIDTDGFLFLTGRKDRMMVIAGKNLFPEEIEDVLHTHPAVANVAVFSFAERKRGARMVCAICARDGLQVTISELIAYARQHIPLYKIPRRYITINDWPRTRTGKTDFERLRVICADENCELST